MIPALTIYRHVKTGNHYVILSRDALIEATMTRAVVYQAIDHDAVWVRPFDEFFDGRFEAVRL